MFAVGFTSGIVFGLQSYGWDLHIWDVPFSYAIPGRKVKRLASYFPFLAFRPSSGPLHYCSYVSDTGYCYS